MARQTRKDGRKKPDMSSRPAVKSQKSKPNPGRGASNKKPGRTSKPAARGSSSRQSRQAPGKPASRSKSTPSPGQSFTSGLSLDRKLDIAGVVLSLLGLLTLLSLISSSRSAITSGWIGMLSKGLGWGIYLLPLTLLVVGLWLVLRNFEQIPLPSPERLLGLSLLYLNLLGILHLFKLPETREASLALADAGQGGGYLGALTLEILRTILGMGGATVALLAWLLIAMALSLDVSVVELFHWLPPLLSRLQDRWNDLRLQRLSKGVSQPELDGFTPLQRGVDLDYELDPQIANRLAALPSLPPWESPPKTGSSLSLRRS